ncbi:MULTISPECIES: 2-oxoglutarate and iron-dependent oxygenase domain-containing protein [unclassified Streptomyces]|uniref:2-oxoglutarate and iron-dependent oxygenase domain-containing protein n=1 Tax=unclassified Streptomyces TaxID=2593676 RepID=UPI00331B045A
MPDDIPTIDLAAALADDAPEELLATVRHAAETLGIIQVVNHGVPTEVIAGFNDGFRRILDLPRAEKEQLASPTGHPNRGWRQWPDDFGRLELERFNIAQYDDTREAEAAGLSPEHATLYQHVNVWPPQEPGLREATHRYRDAFVDVARRVLTLYARVLDVPADTFSLGDDVHTTVVVNNYPKWPYDSASDEEKLLLLEHADSSTVTVLHQEGDYAGLQGQRPDGTWTPVPIRPDALQVFTGTLLTNWTDGRLRPGRHRVVAGGSVTRRSSAVFVHPGLDTVVAPLPAFADPDGSDFEPVSVWERANGNVEEYLRVFGRPEQLAAWRESRPYVAEVIS